jgi:PPOX class probable F420-dependent enzyme
MTGETGAKELLFSQHVGVLATLKRDGRPQLSTVNFTADPATSVIRCSITNDRAKTRNLRRDPRVSLHVSRPDMGAYVVAEGIADLSQVAADPHDAAVDELVEVYRVIRGEHPNWDEFRAAMVAEQRLVLRIPVERSYGWAGR